MKTKKSSTPLLPKISAVPIPTRQANTRNSPGLRRTNQTLIRIVLNIINKLLLENEERSTPFRGSYFYPNTEGVQLMQKQHILQFFTIPKGLNIRQNKIALDLINVSENFINWKIHTNPFNPFTIISYTISQYRHVSARVYTITGQQVTELVNTFQQVGAYQLRLNGN